MVNAFPLSRRRFLAGAGMTMAAFGLPRSALGQANPEIAADGFRVLRARKGAVRLRGRDGAETAIWGYEGGVPGPVLRLKRGEEVKVRLVNELPEATVIHWHGLRLPNAMDGVPHMTQPPVESGQSFDYRFTAPDAGTFWYHSHLFSSEQIERGLYGALIVEEPQPPEIDRELVLVLDDWRLNADGSLHEASFRSFHDAAHAGRMGDLVTVNSDSAFEIPLRRHERLRLRLINAANARVFPLRFEGHSPRVMAIDGQPAQPFLARDGRLGLGPGNRIDLFLDATLEPGTAAQVFTDDLSGKETAIARFIYGSEKARAAPLPDPPPLPPNPLPERIDLRDALRVDAPLDGGAMSQLMMSGAMRRGEIHGHGLDARARIWTIAGFASSGHDGPPLFSVKNGRAVVIAFENKTAFPHAMHIHGHHFRLLDRLDDGWKPFWLDTHVVQVRETARIAFVADNPGKWMIHCHMLEHQETGMAAWFEVT